MDERSLYTNTRMFGFAFLNFAAREPSQALSTTYAIDFAFVVIT